MLQNTIAAIATPAGRGGIAVIRLSGPGAYAVAGRVFKPKNAGKKLENVPGYTAVYGDFTDDDGAVLDDGIVLCFHAPHSYTGEELVELSCHGGEAVTHGLLNACLKAGAAPAQPGEFTRRAVLNGRMSLTQAEAVMELIETTSRRGAAAAHTVLQGGLHRRICQVKEQLVALAGHLAAWTDYPEEDVEALEQATFLKTVTDAEARLAKLIDGYERGAILRRGVRTAIVGSPNVGKSTLFNLMSGFERAIVTPIAGTTRDVVREEIQVGGITLHVADTAGLRATGDVVEKEGIARTLRELEQAGLVIAVFDGSQPLLAGDVELAQKCAGRPALGIINKSDLGTVVQPGQLAPYFGRVLLLSARDDDVVERIEAAVLEALRLEGMEEDGTLLMNERQLAAASEARQALQAAATALRDGLALDAAGVCLDDALRALSSLLGQDATQAVIDEVFSKFCVGK